MKQPNILWICTDQQRGMPCNINGNARCSLPEGVKLVTRCLADAGYDCVLSGKLHLASAWPGVEERVDDGYRRFWYSHSPHQGIGHGNQYTEWLESTGELERVMDMAQYEHAEQRGVRYRDNVPAGLHQTSWCCDRAIEFMNEERTGPWLMSVIELTEIAHTLAEIGEASMHPRDGTRLMPALTGNRTVPTREYVRCEFYDTLDMHFGRTDRPPHRPLFATMTRDERYKLVVYHGSDYGELYDLQKDPDEHENLWAVTECAGVRERLATVMTQTAPVTEDPMPRIGRF